MTQPVQCEYCCYVLMDPLDPLEKRGFYDDSCPAGLCLQFRCARCHGVWSANGPADCPTCSGTPWWYRFALRMSVWIFVHITSPLVRVIKRKR